MGIDYTKLRIMMVKKRLKWTDLHKKAGIGWGSINKINNDESVTLATLEKICDFFNCDIGDIVSIKKDSTNQ